MKRGRPKSVLSLPEQQASLKRSQTAYKKLTTDIRNKQKIINKKETEISNIKEELNPVAKARDELWEIRNTEAHTYLVDYLKALISANDTKDEYTNELDKIIGVTTAFVDGSERLVIKTDDNINFYADNSKNLKWWCVDAEYKKSIKWMIKEIPDYKESFSSLGACVRLLKDVYLHQYIWYVSKLESCPDSETISCILQLNLNKLNLKAEAEKRKKRKEKEKETSVEISTIINL